MAKNISEREKGYLGAIGPAQLYVREELRKLGKLSEDEIRQVSDGVAEKFNAVWVQHRGR